MSLYDIYGICRSPLLLLPAYAVALFSLSSACLYIIKPKSATCETAELFDYFCAKSIIKTLIISLLSIFILLFSSGRFVRLMGCNDFRIMPEGTYCYYVLATNEKGQTYTLPAKIEIMTDVNEDDEKTYCVRNVYFKNGGYLYFEDECQPEKNNKSGAWQDSAMDQNEKDWEIELTSNKTTHNSVCETKPNNLPWLALLSSFSIIITCVFYVYCIKKN